jgi:Na+/melibiose symporter-like transporter
VTQSLGKSRAAVVMAFIVCGMMFGSWASRIPAIKDQAGLDSVHLGFALLGSPLGSVLAMTFAGYAAGRFGSHRITVLMLLVCAAALPLIASASSFFHLGGALFIFGAAYGSMDVCMNANGLAIERAGKSPIMSRLHACWSIGSFIGAFSTTLALQAGLSVFQQFTVLAAAMVAAAVVLSQTMLPERHASTGAIFTRPPRRLVLVGFVALCALIAEGSAGDWSGVFIKDNIGGTAQDAALAITFLSATMAGVRLAGDRLTQILGPARLVALGAVVSALGMLMALVIAQPIAAIVGFGFVGMGVAATYPIALRAAGSQPGIASGVGIAAVATMGSAGVMAAPPLIGSVAGAAGLRVALGMIVVLLVILATTAGRALGSTRIDSPEPAVPIELP